jgi:hypothetical protein
MPVPHKNFDGGSNPSPHTKFYYLFFYFHFLEDIEDYLGDEGPPLLTGII